MPGSPILLRDLEQPGILRLSLNDIARRTALSEEMLAQLDEAFAKAEADLAVRLLVVAAKGPALCAGMTLAVGKRAFYKQLRMPLSEAYDHASEVMVRNMPACDAQEGIGAFIEKRSHEWQDC